MSRGTKQTTKSRLLAVIADAGHPCTLSEVVSRIGGGVDRAEVRRVLFDLTEKGVLYPCTRQRFWDRDESRVHTEHALRLIATRPHTRAELIDALDELGTGASRSWRQSIVRRVATTIGVYRWPPYGVVRSEQLSMQPPDLERYMQPLREPFEALADRLEQAGVARDDIAEAMLGDRLPKPAAPVVEMVPRRAVAPSDEAERDFHREIAQELVFAWEDTQDATARRALEQVMHNVGIRPLGTIGEEVSFDGARHTSNEGLWPDDAARVEQSGWELQRGTRSRVLAKATVRAVGALS